MNYSIISKVIVAALAISMLACVSQKKYTDLLLEKGSLEKKYNDLLKVKEELEICKADRNALMAKLEQSEDDFEELSGKYEDLQDQHQSLLKAYDEQVTQNESILASASSTTQALAEQLSLKETELNEQAKRLTDLENQLQKKEQNINAILKDLEDRERKITELNSLLNQRDATMQTLRESLNDALMGFSKSDLSVYEKNGRIYVSLSQNLLFKTGSDQLDEKGKEALTILAAVLKQNPDVEINVEGHTDSEGSDNFNWDLSVKRATSVVKVLTSNMVPPQQIMASGRGEHHPVATNETDDGKSKNRRTEIILSPKLDELYRIINK